MAKSRKASLEAEREALRDLVRPDPDEGINKIKGQLRTAGKVVAVALIVVWALAAGFASGQKSAIPIAIAAVITIAAGIGAALVVRNLRRSTEYGALLRSDDGLSDEERAARLQKLTAEAAKGDSGAILAKAQLEMQDDPRAAIATLEKLDLDKAPKLIATQASSMRAMLHLNLGEVKAARELADKVDLEKAPDTKTRANLAAVVAEAWARSGNPIEASALLDKYDPKDAQLAEVDIQLYRSRAFACAHKQDITGMKRALKSLSEKAPMLVAMFLGQKRIHPLLEKEARRLLEKSGKAPKPKMQMVRR